MFRYSRHSLNLTLCLGLVALIMLLLSVGVWVHALMSGTATPTWSYFMGAFNGSALTSLFYARVIK